MSDLKRDPVYGHGKTDVARFRWLAAAVAIVCLGIGWLGHLDFFSDLSNGGAAFLRRQSEAYAIIGLFVGFWAWFMPSVHSSTASTASAPQANKPRTSFVLSFAWFCAIGAALLLVTLWDEGPGPLVTLKEAFVAVLVVSGYLMWSRGFSPGDPAVGTATRSREARAAYYVAVLVVAVTSAVPFLDDVVGMGMASLFSESNEAFAAIILISLYFDIAARRSTMLARVIWYSVLIALPVAAQFDGYPGPIADIGVWLQQVTEAFIAAIGISLLFDFVVPAILQRAQKEPSQQTSAAMVTVD